MHKYTGQWRSKCYQESWGSVELDLPYYAPTESFTTKLYITHDPGSARAGETVTVDLEGSFKRDNNGDLQYTLIPAVLDSNQLLMVSAILCDDNVCRGRYASLLPHGGPHPDYGVINVQCTITCRGCLEDLGNQQAHQEPGGCDYVSLSDSDTIELSD